VTLVAHRDSLTLRNDPECLGLDDQKVTRETGHTHNNTTRTISLSIIIIITTNCKTTATDNCKNCDTIRNDLECLGLDDQKVMILLILILSVNGGFPGQSSSSG